MSKKTKIVATVVFILVVVGVFILVNTKDEPTETTASEPVVKDNTVSIECTVADKSNNKHWFIVNENGSMAKNTVLKTSVTTDDFYDAIASITDEKVWNDTDTEFGADESIIDQLGHGIGHDDFAKLDVTVSWDGNTYKLADVIGNPSYKGKEYKGNYDIAYAGNLENQRSEKTGCITCFGGCYMGITSGYDTPMMIEYTPENLPEVGQKVTVTYTAK